MHGPCKCAVLLVAALGAASCRSSADDRPSGAIETSDSRETPAYALNNEAVALLRSGVEANLAGRSDEARGLWRAALERADDAIGAAARSHGPDYAGYDKAWANKAYALWRLDRIDDAVAAATQVRRINPAYVFHPAFVAALSSFVPPDATPVHAMSD